MSNYKHGACGTREYKSWDAMKQRCLNPNDKDFKDYGGRGIVICERWLESFQNFLDDMGERPIKSTLGRKDNDKMYCKSNCEWESYDLQNNNRRNVKKIEFRGQSKTLRSWSQEMNINRDTLFKRIYRDHWTVEEALTTPVRPRHKPIP